jgi:uncharacterized membrane protein YesL
MEREFGTGPLSQLTGSVYRHAILAVSLVLACLPTLVVTTLLSGSTRNVAWLVLAQLPAAPALSAGLYAVRGWRRGDDVGPGSLFWRGYRLNAADVLRWWAPAVAVLAVLATNAANPETVAIGSVLAVVSLVVSALVMLWAGHALVVSSFFSFRTRDVARIAIVVAFSQWRVTLVYLSMLVVAAGVLYTGTEAALLLLAWALVSMLEHVTRPVREEVTRRFTVRD